MHFLLANLLQELDEHLEVGDLRLQLIDKLTLHLERVHNLAHSGVHSGPELVLGQGRDVLHIEIQPEITLSI